MQCDFQGLFQGNLKVGSKALQPKIFESNVNNISSDKSLMGISSAKIHDTMWSHRGIHYVLHLGYGLPFAWDKCFLNNKIDDLVQHLIYFS